MMLTLGEKIMPRRTLKGTLVYLRELREDFFSDYLAAFLERVQKLLHVQNIKSERDYLCTRLEKQKKGQTIFFCLFDSKTDRLIGALEIRDQIETSSQLYSWLHEDFWGTGRYQEVLRLAAQEYFIRTNKIFFSAHVDKKNKRSYFALKKNGFADFAIRNGPHGKQYQLIFRKK